MSTSLSQAPFQPGPPARLPSQCGLDHFSAPRHVQPAPRTGDGGIDQFAREDAVVAAGEEKPDVVEFAALGLVHGGGEGGVVLRQLARRPGGELAVLLAPDHGVAVRSEAPTSELQSLMRISYA